MRKLLFAAAALLAICVSVTAAEKLSLRARRRVGAIRTELHKRVSKEPLDFHELCWIEAKRLGKDEEGQKTDHLQSLYALRHGLHEGIKRLNPYWRPPEEKEKEYIYLHKQYDIADLVTQAPDRPAPTIGFGAGPHLRGSTTREAAEALKRARSAPEIALRDDDEEEGEVIGMGFDWETIECLIERVMPEDEWGEREIRYVGGRLICRITARDARALEDLLRQLRRNAGFSINMEVKFIRVSARYLRELHNDERRSVIYLSPEAQKRLLTDIAAKKGVEIVASSEVIAANNQLVHIREGQQVSLLMDYDINTAGIPTLQPVVKLLNEGLICQFRPTVVRGGKEVCIDILTSLSKIRKEMRKGDFLGGEIMFPAIEMSRLHTTVRVPSATAALVGGTALTRGNDKKDSHQFVVYLKPTIERKKK